MVCVVMIHSYAIGSLERPAAWCVFAQTFLMRTATNWAVQFFFVVSGFFFAVHNLNKSWNGGGYVKLLGKKVKSLLVPYVIWALIGTIISTSLTLLNNYLMHRALFARTFMDANGVWRKINLLFGILSGGPIGNLALWYVRTLMLLFVLSPLFVLMSRLGNKFLLISGLLMAMALPGVSIPYVSIKLGSVGWFCAGMGVAQLSLDSKRMPKCGVLLSGLCWMGLATIGAMEKAGYLALNAVSDSLVPIMSLAGILFWWGFSDLFPICKQGELPDCFKMSFWVYCLHGVITGCFLAAVNYILGKSEWVAMVASLFSVCGTLAFCLSIGLFVKHRFLKAYAVLSGGR